MSDRAALYAAGWGWVYPDKAPVRPAIVAQLDAIRLAGRDHKHDWQYADDDWTAPVLCAICGVGGLDVAVST